MSTSGAAHMCRAGRPMCHPGSHSDADAARSVRWGAHGDRRVAVDCEARHVIASKEHVGRAGEVGPCEVHVVATRRWAGCRGDRCQSRRCHVGVRLASRRADRVLDSDADTARSVRGELTVIDVSLLIVKLVTSMLPKNTSVAVLKLVPVGTHIVATAVEPLGGVSPSTSAAPAIRVYGWLADVPAGVRRQ